jgi:hypothetical protein
MSVPHFHRFLVATLLTIAALCAMGAAKKPTLSVRFHVESIGNAGGSFTMPAKFKNPPRDGNIESIPFASERNVTAIFPVIHPDGSIGCAFQLDRSGALGLETVSTDRRGASMVAFIASKAAMHQVIDLPIDKPIRDGIIYLPTGLTPGELEMLKKKFPIMASKKKAEAPATTARQ